MQLYTFFEAFILIGGLVAMGIAFLNDPQTSKNEYSLIL
jgi:hypothetical protein